MKISLIIPMYQEEAVVDATVKEVKEYMDRVFGTDYEVIFVDDGSKDEGVKKLTPFLNERIRLISYTQNQGKGYAIRQGVLSARGEISMFTDCDLAYGLDVVKKFYETMEREHADIAVGSRNLSPEGYEGYTWLRRAVSKLYIQVLCLWGGLELSDSQCGCKAFRTEMGKKIFSRCEINRFAFDFEAILIGKKMKANIVEIPVKILRHGPSSVHIVKDSVKMLRDISKMKKRIRKMEIEK